MNLRALRRALRCLVYETPVLVRERDGTIGPARGCVERPRVLCRGNALRGTFDIDDAIERETILVREELATYHLAPELGRC